MAVLRTVALAIAAAAGVSARTFTYTPEEFQLIGRADAGEMLRFSAALPMREGAQEWLDSELMAVADPDSPRYGQWLSQATVATMTGPEPALREEVRAWLAANMNAECVDFPTSLRCQAPVSGVEAALKTKVSTFSQATRAGRLVHRIATTDAYTWPAELSGKVQFLTNLVDFPTERRKLGKTQALEAVGRRVQTTDWSVVPETIRDLYNVKAAGNVKSIQAPAEFQNDTSYNKADLKTFAAKMGLADWTVAKTVGPYDGSDPDAEASLDTQYIGAVAQNTTAWYWTEEDWMYEWTETLKATPDSGLPNVFSVSWGWSEADQATIDPGHGTSAAYVTSTNANFAAVTARGISILVSSGDSGAHGRTDDSCTQKKTRPDWPTASPYITAVGATQLVNGVSSNPTSPYCKGSPSAGPCATGGSEIVCSTATGALIVSGGGFSNIASTPSWQSAAVAGYLKSGALLPPKGDYNTTGRGYPDVAALGHNYIIWLSGADTPVDGTSCSAPVWGGLVALINSARLAAGKSVVGFLNPALYKLYSASPTLFTDITKGDNTCTEDGCVTGCTGFGATAGWDSVTGMGTPVFDKLLAAFVALP